MTKFHNLANLVGRSALVTGGAGHIGRVVAETLAELGAQVTISDLASSQGDAVAATLSESTRGTVSFIPADLSNRSDTENLVTSTNQNLGGLDILVHAAAMVGTSGLPGWSVEFAEQSVETWDMALRVNLTSAFVLAQAAAPYLRLSGSGSIVLISSIYGFLGPDPSLYEGTPMASPAAYSASKGGLEQLARWLASTLAPDVRVNSICPGGVERGQLQEFKDRYCAKTPLGRMASEEDFRGVIGFLCSDLSAYMTGQSLVLDGGLSIR